MSFLLDHAGMNQRWKHHE